MPFWFKVCPQYERKINLKKKKTAPKRVFGKLREIDIIMIIGNWLPPFKTNPDEMHPEV